MGKRKISQAEDVFNEAIGKQIAIARRRNKLTQRRLAAGIGLAQQTMASIECGRTRCTPYMLKRIALLLGIEVAALIPNTSSCCIPEHAS